MDAIRVILFGAGEFACPLLRALHGAQDVQLVAVAVPPDRPSGRGRQPVACALKAEALTLGLAPMESGDVSSPEFVETLAKLEPDAMVVADFGQFLRKNLLAVPRWGTLNVHPSLLPKYRGASPVQWALANGDEQTGVCVLWVTPKMDAGDVLACAEERILPEDTAPTLEARLAKRGAELLVDVVRGLREGRRQGVPQATEGITFARKLTREDGYMDWHLPAVQLVQRGRGFSPWPGLFTLLPDGSVLKVHAVRAEPLPPTPGEPGQVVSCEGEGPLVMTGDGAVRLLEVQPAGKKRMSGAAFCRGRGLRAGDRLG